MGFKVNGIADFLVSGSAYKFVLALTLVASRSGARIGGGTALGVQHPRVDVVPSLLFRREVWVLPTLVGGGSRGNGGPLGLPLWESLACEFALSQDPSASVAAVVLRL